jgi:hypothetical protein
LDQSTLFEVDGHIATAGLLVNQQDVAIATWIAGDHMVSLSAQLPVEELVAIARTVHEVAPNVWDGMKFQATHNNQNASDDYSTSNAVAVSTGTDADGKDWTVNVTVGTMAKSPYDVSWQWTGSGFAHLISASARIDTVVEGRRTYVLADVPPALAATSQLQVLRDGMDAVNIPLVDVDPTFDRTFAAYAFSEPVRYTAQIVADGGAVLATWPSA